MQMNRLSQNSFVCAMLKGKDYCAADMVFPTLRAYIDRATESKKNPIITGVHRMYSGIVLKVVSQNYGRG